MIRLLAPLIAIGLLASPASAREVKLIVPFAAGGVLDVSARAWASSTGGVIVENQPGAGGQIGAAFVAKADPDGWTLLLSTVPAAMGSIDKLRPIAIVSAHDMAIALNGKVPADTLPEFASYARNRNLAYGSPGVGTPSHLLMEAIKSRYGMDLVHVPYRGDAPALADLVDGRVPIMVVAASDRVADLRASRLLKVIGEGLARVSHVLFAPAGTAIAIPGDVARTVSDEMAFWARGAQ